MNKNRKIKTLAKKISVVAASAAMATSALVAPAFAAGSNYTDTIEGVKTTTFDKYLVMDKQAHVPNSSFTYAVTAGPAKAFDVAGKTMEILAGITPEKVTMAGVGGDKTAPNTIEFKQGDVTEEGANALVKNYDNTTEKYAKKTATLDFSQVVFPEPGIYRYVITESGNNQAITNDADLTRVVDVYVHDKSDAMHKKLEIAGYVLHSNVNDAPTVNMDAPSGEFGSTGSYVSTKSQGFTNEYTTHDLTIKEEVTGNQASRDKYFKFTVNITNAVAGTKYDVDIAKADATVSKNAATLDEYEGKSNPTSITVGPDGNATADFYLQHGQEVKINGIADTTSYNWTQVEEDYKKDAAASVGYTDEIKASIKKDSKTSFKNTRNGQIPTGVIMTVAPFAVVTLVGGIGLVTMVMKKNKKDE